MLHFFKYTALLARFESLMVRLHQAFRQNSAYGHSNRMHNIPVMWCPSVLELEKRDDAANILTVLQFQHARTSKSEDIYRSLTLFLDTV